MRSLSVRGSFVLSVEEAGRPGQADTRSRSCVYLADWSGVKALAVTGVHVCGACSKGV